MGNIKHRKSYSKIYNTWKNMISRCYNKKNKCYKYYGECGIKVCEEWLVFNNFYRDMGDAPDGLTLERRKNDLGYSKDNCMWANRGQQSSNKRSKNKTGFRGVFLNSDKNFTAQIGFNGKRHHIGIFKTAELAHLAYQACKSVLYPQIIS